MIVRGVRLLVAIAAGLVYAASVEAVANLDFITVKAFLAIGLFYLAFSEFQRKSLPTGMVCLAGTCLFQPFSYRYSVRLPLATWQHLDLALACIMGLWAIAPSKAGPDTASDKAAASFVYFVTKVLGNGGLFLAHFWACLTVAKWKGVFLALLALVTPPIAIVCVAIREAYVSDRISPYLWTLIATIACLGCCFSAAYSLAGDRPEHLSDRSV